MTLSHNETQRLIDLVLGYPREVARAQLHLEIGKANLSEPEFCAGIMEHGKGMSYKSEQWADFLSKIPNLLFRDERWLINKLSEKQRQQLRLNLNNQK